MCIEMLYDIDRVYNIVQCYSIVVDSISSSLKIVGPHHFSPLRNLSTIEGQLSASHRGSHVNVKDEIVPGKFSEKSKTMK